MESSNRLRRYSLHRNFPLFVLEDHIRTIGLALVSDTFSNIVRRHDEDTIAKDAVKQEEYFEDFVEKAAIAPKTNERTTGSEG